MLMYRIVIPIRIGGIIIIDHITTTAGIGAGHITVGIGDIMILSGDRAGVGVGTHITAGTEAGDTIPAIIGHITTTITTTIGDMEIIIAPDIIQTVVRPQIDTEERHPIHHALLQTDRQFLHLPADPGLLQQETPIL